MLTIQKYLNDFRKSLPRHMRDEAVAEVYCHLEALASEGERQGLSRAEAETQAVRQFGLPRKISTEWRRAAGVIDWFDVILATLPLLGITGLSWYFVGQFLPFGVFLLMFGAGGLVAWLRAWPTWWYAWLGWLFLALLVIPASPWVFFLTFPLLVTLLAVDSWEQATLMTLPFTTYLAFTTIIERQQLVTTGWGPGNIYPGNMIWLETAFSLLWVIILAASLRAARPSRRGVYLLAGLIGTQLMYVSVAVLTVVLGNSLPAYFVSDLSTTSLVFYKLPMGLLTIALTVYPLFVWLIARYIRQSRTQSGLTA
jgi:hypothetical protein